MSARVLQVEPAGRWSEDGPLPVLKVVDPDAALPIFGAQRWDLSCIYLSRSRLAPTLDFGGMSDYETLVAKELIAARLCLHVERSRASKHRGRHSAVTLNDMLCTLKQVFSFMRERGVTSVANYRQEHIDEFLRHLQAKKIHQSRQASMIGIFVWLYESDSDISGGGLSFDPWGGQACTKVVGHVQPRETLTKRIPPDVIAGLMAWATAYVDHFSHDILAGVEAVGEMNRERARSEQAFRATDASEERRVFDNYLTQELRVGAALPGRLLAGKMKPAYTEIAARVNVRRNYMQTAYARARLAEAAAELGLEETRPGLTTFVPEGCTATWRRAMTPHEVARESSNLVLAAYIICSYLSGMRDSELQALERGCVLIERDEDGAPIRYKLRGHTRKGKTKPVARTWVVIEPVARAIKVLEALPPSQSPGSSALLFVQPSGLSKGGRPFRQRINMMLRAFVAHCNGVLLLSFSCGETRAAADKTRLRAIPDGPNGPWDLKTSQFRKTLAWFIANRPLGLAALMIQYGHASIQMAEGYAGEKGSGFQQEIAAEELTARTGDLMAIYDDRKSGIFPAGPFAAELEKDFQEIERQIGPLEGQVVDEFEFKRLLRHRAERMRLGPYADCFFVPSRARCLIHVKDEDRREPIIGLCDPHCSQACWRKSHVEPWRELQRRAEAQSRDNKIGAFMRDRLRAEAATAAKIVKEIEEAGRGEGSR